MLKQMRPKNKNVFLRKIYPYFIFTILLIFVAQSPTYANDPTANDDVDYIAVLDDLIESQRKSPKLLDTKLTIDGLIDKNLGASGTRKKLAAMVDDVNAMIKPVMSGWDKVDSVRTYLYEPGPWNDESVFSYDHSDPQGLSAESRLLHNYLHTRLGNCVSMPVLQAILSQEIGLDMALSTAPLHIFIKYTAESGETINLEATSGGYPARAEWYQKNLPMLPKAIENGMYMSKLSPEQTIAVLGQDLASHLLREGKYSDAITVSDKLIELFPNYAPLHMVKGSAIYGIIKRDFQTQYPDANDIPSNLRPKFGSLMRQNAISFQTAEDLGWTDPDALATRP
jgi:regulator of sirC expression with transglutaminase-like and TPR domain